MAQFVSTETIANTPRSPQFTNIISHNDEKINTSYEKNLGEKSYYAIQAVPDTKAKTLFIVTSFIGKQGYKKEVSQFINAKSLDVTSEIEIATPSMNIIPPNDQKINTSDEKNSKPLNNPLNNEEPIGADSNEKLSQDELRATLKANVADVVNVLKISQKEKISSTVTCRS